MGEREQRRWGRSAWPGSGDDGRQEEEGEAGDHRLTDRENSGIRRRSRCTRVSPSSLAARVKVRAASPSTPSFQMPASFKSQAPAKSWPEGDCTTINCETIRSECARDPNSFAGERVELLQPVTMHCLSLTFLALAVLFTMAAATAPDGGQLTEPKDGLNQDLRSLFMYEPGKREPWSAFNVIGLAVCLVIGGLLACCCLWLRHRQPNDLEHLYKNQNGSPFYAA